jgi:uncharacterized protein (DUF3084 family)
MVSRLNSTKSEPERIVAHTHVLARQATSVATHTEPSSFSSLDLEVRPDRLRVGARNVAAPELYEAPIENEDDQESELEVNRVSVSGVGGLVDSFA